MAGIRKYDYFYVPATTKETYRLCDRRRHYSVLINPMGPENSPPEDAFWIKDEGWCDKGKCSSVKDSNPLKLHRSVQNALKIAIPVPPGHIFLLVDYFTKKIVTKFAGTMVPAHRLQGKFLLPPGGRCDVEFRDGKEVVEHIRVYNLEGWPKLTDVLKLKKERSIEWHRERVREFVQKVKVDIVAMGFDEKTAHRIILCTGPELAHKAIAFTYQLESAMRRSHNGTFSPSMPREVAASLDARSTNEDAVLKRLQRYNMELPGHGVTLAKILAGVRIAMVAGLPEQKEEAAA